MKTNFPVLKIRIRPLLALLCVATATLLSSAPIAQAGYVVTLEQVGADVVATGSGPIDLSGLTFNQNAAPGVGISPFLGHIQTGQIGGTLLDLYSGFTGPTSFGSGHTFSPNTASGDLVGIRGFQGVLVVPQGYVSGAALSDSMTFNNTRLGSFGVTAGTFEWTWGTGVNQNFTLQIIGPVGTVPDYGSTVGLLLLGLAALLSARRLRLAYRS